MSAPYGEKWVSDCGTVTLYCGDCLEVLPTLEAGSVDAVVTDPPYGAGGDVSGRRRQNGFRVATNYIATEWEDTVAYIQTKVVPAASMAIEMSKRAAITPGFKCMNMYPTPAHVGNLYYGAQSATTCWGMAYWQPILLYGKDPHPMQPDTIKARPNPPGFDIGHPCPKEIRSWTDVVNRVTDQDDCTLDPFMGSGTTGVACVRLGRRFIGIELEPKYFAIAKRRIIDELKRVKFLEPPKREVQRTLLEADA